MLYYVVTGILFLWNSVQDIKRRTLSNKGLLIGMGAIVLLFAANGLCSGMVAEIMLLQDGVPWQNIWGVLPGVGILVLSLMLKGSIGKGDGYLLCISGLALGLKQNLSILFYGLFLAGGTAAVLLGLGKVKRDTKLPFVPFLLGGFVLTVLQPWM